MVEITFLDTMGVAETHRPRPATSVIPEWFKKTNSYINEDKRPEEGRTTGTIKRCMPVFDAITAGYIIPTYCDIFVSKDKGIAVSKSTGEETPFVSDIYQWPSHEPLGFHPAVQALLHPWKTNQFSPVAKWMNAWSITTPKGYSCLFIPPLHRPEMIKILPGVVDTDTYSMPVNFPFVLADPDFEGFIPAGTPLAQVIPFKREQFKMKIATEVGLTKELFSQKTLLRSKLFDAYKTIFRQTKEYK